MAGPLAALLLGSFTACRPERGAPPAPAPSAHGPRLVLLLVVDQLRSDDLQRLRPLLTGGIGRLLAEGVVFTDARHGHAITETAPGHASIATGSFPRRHGIIANSWTDRASGEQGAAVDDEKLGESPRRLLVSTLGDWLKAAAPAAKVYAASGKARSAILLGGSRADGAFWYDEETGELVTSEYYGASPGWLDEFNAQRLLDAHYGRLWEPLPVPEAVLAAHEVEQTDLGPLAERLPHAFGGLQLAPHQAFYEELYASPFLDQHVAAFARRLIEVEDLGGDAAPDLLALGFSALDLVGHDFGPNSREALDTLLRLDRTVGELLDLIDERVGREGVLVALSADHGVAPLPEFQRARGRPGQRAGQREVLCLQAVGAALAEELGPGRWLLPGPFLNEAALAQSGVSRAAAEAAARRAIERCPAVVRAWTRSDLAEPAGEDADPYREPFVAAFHPERSPDFLIQFDEWLTPHQTMAATHGSPYDYDARVPLVLRLPGARPVERTEPALTVDLAPTLAARLGLRPLDEVDGRDLLAAR